MQLPDTSLRLESRRGDARATESAGKLRLRGEVRWLVRGSVDDIDSAEQRLTGIASRLDAGLLELDFGNAVGLFDLGDLGTLEVVSRKWGQGHFAAMLEDVTRVASSMPYAAGTKGALPYDRTLVSHDEVLYHSFVYVRQAMLQGSLLPALRSVLHDPHQRPLRERHRCAPEAARDLDTQAMIQIAEGRVPLMMVPAAVANRIPLAAELGSNMPEWVTELQVRQTLDTAENRFVKLFLELVEGLIDRIEALTDERIARRRTRKSTVFEDRVLADCTAMSSALRPIRQAGMWQSVGRMSHFPASSTVLQRRSGYREIFGHFSRMRTATRLPLDPDDARRLLEIKDIAVLYELWTFYEAVEAVRRQIGPPLTTRLSEATSWHVGMRHGLEVRWQEGVRLWYNRRYAPTSGSGQRSYSVPLRPDMAFLVPCGPNKGLHLLDAKFRLERFGQLADAVADDEGASAYEREEQLGKYKLADLYKMHTYRDAIDGARTVWILYPGSETRFFSADGSSVTSVAALEDRHLDGVGAVPLRPEENGRQDLDALVGCLLRA